MFMEVINGLFLGAAIGLVIALPAIVAEICRRDRNLPILVDVHACWGQTCKRSEVFWLSLFVHELMAMAFGGLYMLLLIRQWYFLDFRLLALLEYAIYFWLVYGGIVLPLARLGFFGRREGRWVWLELLIAHHLLGFGLWLTLELFPVFRP